MQKNEEVIKLLKEIKNLQNHQKEILKLKGESFNIFSILQVETKENKTHSNFIAELLNPKGSHYMGTVFLEAFLKIINYNKALDLSTVEVKKEHHIAKKRDLDGGRIDILIQDKKGNFISIENKIHAVDQDNQLIRYYNFKKGKNTLYYLNLWGTDASEKATEYKTKTTHIKLKSGVDYFPLSYANHIINWLIQCRVIAINQPQIRDSINQYILLLKKLTNQMLDPKAEELQKKLFEYHEAAQYISDNFLNVKNAIKERFRLDIVHKLKHQLDANLFAYQYPNSVATKGIAQIFVELKRLSYTHFQFLIESFSGYGHINGNLFIGVLDHAANNLGFPLSGQIEGFDTKYWKNIKILTYKNGTINLNNNVFLSNLVDVKSKIYNDVLEEVSKQCVDFITVNYPSIEKYWSNKKPQKEV